MKRRINVRRLGALAAAGALVLAASGCVRVETAAEVTADDRVNGTMVIALDKTFMKMVEQMDDSEPEDGTEASDGDAEESDSSDGESSEAEQMADEFLDDVPEHLEAKLSSSPYEEDGFVGTRVHFDDLTLAEFNVVMTMEGGDEPAAGGAIPEGSEPGYEVDLTREGDRFMVKGLLDLSTVDEESADADSEDGAASDGAEDLGLDFSGLEDLFSGATSEMRMSVALTFPGDVVESTGDVEGRTVTWVAEAGERVEVTAVAEDGGLIATVTDTEVAGVPAWLFAMGAALAAVVVAALAFFAVRMRRRPQAQDGAAAPGGDQPPMV